MQNKKIKTLAFRLSHSENEEFLDLMYYYSKNGVTVSQSAVIKKLINEDWKRLIDAGLLEK